MVISMYTVDHKILCLGLIQSLFEGSMYIFVLEWTPALTPHKQTQHDGSRHLLEEGGRTTIPHGYIFAGFMVGKLNLKNTPGTRYGH